MFDFIKKRAIENRAEDEILYEYVIEELEQDVRIKGLWAKAYANSEGDKNKIEPLYMQYRVQAIKDVFSSLEIMYTKLSREKLFNFILNGFKEPTIVVKSLPTKKQCWKRILEDGYTEYGGSTLRNKNLDIFSYTILNNSYVIKKDGQIVKSYQFE